MAELHHFKQFDSENCTTIPSNGFVSTYMYTVVTLPGFVNHFESNELFDSC